MTVDTETFLAYVADLPRATCNVCGDGGEGGHVIPLYLHGTGGPLDPHTLRSEDDPATDHEPTTED